MGGEIMLSRGLRNVLIALTIIIAIIVVILLFVRFALPRIMVRVLLSEKESFLIDTEIQEEIRVFRDTAIGGLREAGISEEDAIGILEQVKTKKVLKGLDRLRQEQITDPAIAFDIMFEELNIEGLKEVVENASGMSINELKTNLRIQIMSGAGDAGIVGPDEHLHCEPYLIIPFILL
jgi:hypothetical protein